MTSSAAELVTLTNTDPRFYHLIGPFLGRREVHRAVGSPVWDDDGKTWLAVLTGKTVAGFLAYRGQRDITVAESCYIARRDAHGNEETAVRAALVQKLIDVTHPSPLTTMVPNEVADVYIACGFTELLPKSTKNFTYLVRNAE